MSPGADPWAIVVPVKRLSAAKSRLAVDSGLRAEIALAMALDTVRACAEVALVVAVSDDDRAAPMLRALGAVVVADEPDAGLNPALRHGAEVAVREHAATAVAAVASDLPALQPAELADTLRRAAAHPAAVVADWSGAGTTLLTATPPPGFRPAYGPGSRAAHLAAGAVDLTETAGAGLRRDVDTLDDLRAAIALGCGPATTEVAHRHASALAVR